MKFYLRKYLKFILPQDKNEFDLHEQFLHKQCLQFRILRKKEKIVRPREINVYIRRLYDVR
jgi:hypothetical protein